MEKINWENGELIKNAYVTVDDVEYPVTPEEVEGVTPLDADNLNLMQDNIEDAIDELKTQKILWSGCHYMTAEQTINLAEQVSEQNNGIILVFSNYTASEGQSSANWNWQTFYIPKIMLNLSTGTGFSFVLAHQKFTSIGTKYLYIYNNRITGNATNDDTGTTNGITFANNKYVLRYVIGV